MCRHVGYLGSPIPLDEILLRPAHSLLRQSWAPRDMRRGGTVNADGFGVGWYTDGATAPVRYRSTAPMWRDTMFPGIAGCTSSGTVVGAVRSATEGMPVVETACAPFTDGRWLFSHNGRVRGWPESLAPLASTLDVTELMTLDAPTDSAVLWALLRRRLATTDSPAEAVTGLVTEVADTAPGSRLNLLLTDGTVLIATTWTHALWLRGHGPASDDGVLVASEPLDDDPRWQEIDDGHIVVAEPGRAEITPLVGKNEQGGNTGAGR